MQGFGAFRQKNGKRSIGTIGEERGVGGPPNPRDAGFDDPAPTAIRRLPASFYAGATSAGGRGFFRLRAGTVDAPPFPGPRAHGNVIVSSRNVSSRGQCSSVSSPTSLVWAVSKRFRHREVSPWAVGPFKAKGADLHLGRSCHGGGRCVGWWLLDTKSPRGVAPSPAHLWNDGGGGEVAH